MKLKNIGSLLLALAAVGATASAGSAQVLNTPTTTVQNPFSVKVGAFFPTSASDKTVGGSTQLSIGVDYALAKTTDENPSLPSIYADFNGGSKSGGHIDSFGVGVAVRSFTNSAANKMSPYMGAGAGVYYSSGNKTGSTKTNFGVGAKVFAGVDIGAGFFLEGNYQFLPGVAGINPSGFGLQAGYRF